MANLGLDVGTSFIVLSKETSSGVEYTEFRDAFYVIKPTTPVAQKMIEKGLSGKVFIKDEDGSFILLGKDAIEKAIERNDTAKRPMHKGVVSAKEKDAKRVLAYILKEVAGKASQEGEKIVFCVPAQPVDIQDDDFDVGYHEDVVQTILAECGYDARSINEAEALCYAELENDDYTGVAISCLIAGTKIYTKRGILDIKDVKVGDEVITHKGRWKKITNIIVKDFTGVSTSLKLKGYSDDFDNYKFVDNHELYVYRDNKWGWVGCEDIKVGDIVGEPIINYDRFGLGQPTMTICERITSSSQINKKSVAVSPDVQRLIGYFLGDGSVNVKESCIQFDFHIDEKDNISDVQEILLKNFNKKSNATKKGKNCIRVKCYSRGMVSWFKNHFYDENKNKKYPWEINRLTKNECLNLLAGLIRSDGWYNDIGFAFSNTCTNLVILVKQLCSRLDLAASIYYREPRTAVLKDKRIIKGKKRDWTVAIGTKMSSISVQEYIKNVNCNNNIISEKMFINDSFCCTYVQDIKYEDYEGKVYDIQVEDDHSFSGPYLTIHNCGSGMQNVCVMLNGEPTVKFSVTHSGDWLDRMVAVATGEKDSVVQAEKENGDFTIGQPSDNHILNAMSGYYVRLIDYVTKHISSSLENHPLLPKFKQPLTIVVAGGTSLAKGYVDMFASKLQENNFPLPIKVVRHASDPLHAVSKGCLIASKVL